jgi:hypothetical protein
VGRASARPKWGVDPESIRDALIEKHIAADSKLAQFVGIKAYEKAGGAVLRDLFDDENAGWLTDPALVNQLAAAKLEKAAEAVRAEGWKWVEIMPDLAWESTKDFGKAQPTRLPPTAEQQKEIDKLTAEGNAILDQHGEDPDDDEVRDRFYEIQERIDELQQGGEERTADDKANAGAIIGIGNDGKPDIRRGLIKPEDRAAAKKGDKERNGAAKTGETGEAENPGLSAKLVEDLTAHRGITSDAVRQSEGGARCHRSRLGARLPLQHKPSLLRQGQRFNDLSEPQRRRHRRQRGRKGVCRDHQSRHQGHAEAAGKAVGVAARQGAENLAGYPCRLRRMHRGHCGKAARGYGA